MVSIERYFERIRYGGSATPDEAVLAALHLAHAQAIPFENLDIHLGKAIGSDVSGLFTKMVLNRRGGYCFEQNGLFGAMLERLGFRTRHALGRVTFGAQVPRPRGHLLNLVEIGSRRWIADVGFGGYGLLEPVPFEPGREHRAGGETYRIVNAAGAGFELEMKGMEGWKSLYWFDETPCYAADVDVMNFYHSHSPASFFHQNRVVALAGRDRRVMLTNDELKVVRGGTAETRLIADEDAYCRVLAEEFGIELPGDPVADLRPHPSIPKRRSAA